MSPENFVFWLNGAFEINPNFGKDGLTPEQVKVIKDHLYLVFKHVAGVPDDVQLEPTGGNHEFINNAPSPAVPVPAGVPLPYTPRIGDLARMP